jgi:hypothetical protein
MEMVCLQHCQTQVIEYISVQRNDTLTLANKICRSAIVEMTMVVENDFKENA